VRIVALGRAALVSEECKRGRRQLGLRGVPPDAERETVIVK